MCCTPLCYRFYRILAQVKVIINDWLTERMNKENVREK